MTLEGAIGLTAAVRAGSVSLLGWALSSVVEGLASVIVIWRFSGTRTLSESSERRAQTAVAGSFWLLAPSIAIDSVHALVRGDRPGVSILGTVSTASSVLVVPVLGRAKQHLRVRLESGATTAEGLQNWLCAATGVAFLLGLVANATLGVWWLDPSSVSASRPSPSGKAPRPGVATAAANPDLSRFPHERCRTGVAVS